MQIILMQFCMKLDSKFMLVLGYFMPIMQCNSYLELLYISFTFSYICIWRCNLQCSQAIFYMTYFRSASSLISFQNIYRLNKLFNTSLPVNLTQNVSNPISKILHNTQYWRIHLSSFLTVNHLKIPTSQSYYSTLRAEWNLLYLKSL